MFEEVFSGCDPGRKVVKLEDYKKQKKWPLFQVAEEPKVNSQAKRIRFS